MRELIGGHILICISCILVGMGLVFLGHCVTDLEKKVMVLEAKFKPNITTTNNITPHTGGQDAVQSN